MSMITNRVAAAAAGLVALLSLSPASRAAEPDAELDKLRKEIAELRQSYESRLQDLERRLGDQATRSRGEAAPAAAAAAPEPARAQPQPIAPSSSASAFNPAISLVLGGSYANLSRNPANYRLQGFIPSGGEVGPGERGFRIGESELSLSASIDPFFSGRLTAGFSGEGEVEVEEAWIERTGLFNNATLRAGRFLSGIGYLNEHHAHTWDFVDAPLAYQAFFGGTMKTDGLQLRWLAPMERYLELAAEIGSGAAFPAASANRNRIGSAALFAHVGGDVGTDVSWRAGLSLLRHRARDRSYEDTNAAGDAVTNAFGGRSRTWALDGVLKWAPGGNATGRSLTIQGEYFRRTEQGSLAYDTGQPAASRVGDYRASTSGWYVQTVHQFMPSWRVGARYDRLSSGAPRLGLVRSGALSAADFPILVPARPSRAALMLDYSPTEFSRVRLQLGADRSIPGATDRQVFLQYIMSLGAHGAHPF
jgi:hypothetical protein